MHTMVMTFTNFDTLAFAKKLEEAGVEPKIAETHAELQAEFQEKIYEAFVEYKPVLDELKITKHEFATKSDINSLRCEFEGRFNKIEGKIDSLRNELILKLGGIMVASTTVICTMIAFILHH